MIFRYVSLTPVVPTLSISFHLPIKRAELYLFSAMIHVAIRHLTHHLNVYLGRTFSLSEELAVMSNITEQDGSVAVNINNKIAVFLVNIEKDTSPRHNGDNGYAGTPERLVRFSPLHLNLYLMFSANFGGSNYPEALKFLSHTIGFFQKNPVFTRQNTPDLDPRIDKLILDMENLNIKDLSSLWSILSGKYQPSVLYRVRMLTFAADDIRTKAGTVSAPDTRTGLG